jgi:ATP-dependent Clp endopeptidase proteolytic subunit ClpP
MAHSDTSSSSDSETSSEKVKVVGSDVYFYCEVNSESITELILKTKKLERTLRKRALDLPGYRPRIQLFIRSEGGDVYAGFSAYDHLRMLRVPLITISDGLCASAATFILLAGKKRLMAPHSHVLIHQISLGSFWGGNFNELQDEMKTCKKLMQMLKDLYTARTSLPESKLKKLMKRDIVLSVDECLRYDIVHQTFCP